MQEVISINFNKRIYPIGAIKKAVEDYNDLAKFVINNNNKYVNVAVSHLKDTGLGLVIKDEFCNYIVSLIKAS